MQEWNEHLQERVRELGSSSAAAAVFVFSAHNVLAEVLDAPADFGFGPDDPTTEGGEIWADGLHITERVHEIFADKLFSAFSETLDLP
jgi:phospholipase/lecithinase/hemolysin